MYRPSRPRRASGHTLAELLAALGIVAVLAGVAAPGMAELLRRGHADAALDQMAGAIRFTRHLAVAQRVTATLCPGGGAACGRRDTWHEGALVFVDANGNGRREQGERVVRRLPPLGGGYRVYWRSFGNRNSLSMLPTGVTNWQNGNMRACPPDGDARNARQLIVNARGRVRLARDSDGDGVVEDAGGRPVTCRT